MKHIYSLLSVLLLSCAILVYGQEPAMTIKTLAVSGTNFYFHLSSHTPDVKVTVDFGEGTTPKEFTLGNDTLTEIRGTTAADQTIKVYGNAESLLSLRCPDGYFITSIDVSKCTTMQAIHCDNNELREIDVTNIPSLIYLSLRASKLTAIDVSKNPNLKYLYLSSGYTIESLDVSKNPELELLNISDCRTIKSLDVSKNLKMISLSCDACPITEIDVSNLTELQSLVTSYTFIESLDVSKNTKLTSLYCSVSNRYDKYIRSLDITNLPDLEILFCSGQKLTELDLSKNTKLKSLFCSNCLLSSLDLSNCPELLEISLFSNYFTFATLPVLDLGFYVYSPQKKISVPQNIKTGEEFDLSDQLLVDGNMTKYKWKTKAGKALQQYTDYIVSEGKTTFLKTQSDSVFCEMENSFFPGLVISTTNVHIEQGSGIDNASMSTTQVFAEDNTINISVVESCRAMVFDISGKMISEKQLQAGNNQIVVSQPGVYFVKINNSKNTDTHKVLIK